MALIFGFSTGAGSSQHTSRIIGPVLRWLIPGIADTTVDRVQFVVRKGGHLSEYAALAWLLWRARRQPVKDDSRPWRWSEGAFALVVAVLFAASDEVHQSFVPSREARFGDVCIDAAGAALGLLALHAQGRWRRRW
jgi:VanZ family protein